MLCPHSVQSASPGQVAEIQLAETQLTTPQNFQLPVAECGMEQDHSPPAMGEDPPLQDRKAGCGGGA